jgi:hypothetical protein
MNGAPTGLGQRTDEAVADIDPGRMTAAARSRDLTGDADLFPVTDQAG